ncbi:MAG: AAA family ATPase, partial [Gammaproteobacteria bacterium]|nr:AAA family ATPase [Gammaproteobacteria bacterium]
MEFRRVDISRFRNIDRAEINFAPGLNFIYGGNGSGKSSLLEALYLLSCGRSFRTARDADYVKTGAAHTVVSAQLKTEAGGQQRVGMSRRVGFNEYRFNGS